MIIILFLLPFASHPEPFDLAQDKLSRRTTLLKLNLKELFFS